jgi:hypothetical protein
MLLSYGEWTENREGTHFGCPRSRLRRRGSTLRMDYGKGRTRKVTVAIFTSKVFAGSFETSTPTPWTV